MSITLRYTATDTGGKTSELSYQEMNDNLKSYYYSSSLSGSVLKMHTTGSDTHSIDLAGFLDNTNTNIYNTDGALSAARTVTADANNLTFDFNNADFKIISDTHQNVTIENLATGDTALVLGIDVSGNIKAMSTGSIPGTGVASNLYTANGTLTSARTVTANANNLTFSFADADFTIGSGGGTGGDVIISDLRQASTDSMMMINAGTGVVSWMSTGSLLVSATPGGSDTYVQFNDGGTFGGDDTFTWNKTSNYLTLKGNISSPSLRLVNATPASSAGVVLGYISAYQDTLAAADVGGFKIVADGTFSNGDVPTRLELLTTPDGTETPTVKLTVKNDGKLVASQYGSGTFTGTAAYNLSVDSSGNVIETGVAGPDLAQPSAVTHTFNGDIVNNSNYAWAVEVGSGTSAPNSGFIRIGHSSPGSKSITTVTAISIHRTSANSTITSNVLDYLCEEGTIAFRTTGGSIVADTIKIKAVDNSNPSYVIVYVDPSASSGNIDTSTTYRLDFQTDALIPLLDQNYNRIVLNNLASSSPAAVLVPPTTANVGDYYLVEVSAGSSNAGSFVVSYANYITGATTTYNINRQASRYLAGTNTVTPISLDYSSYGQAAILHLRVHKVAGAAASFALIGADKVLS